MASSTKKRPESPAEAVQDVAKYLRTNATWEDVINKITRKKTIHALKKANQLSPDSKQYNIAKKLGRIGFSVVIFSLILLSIIVHTNTNIPFSLELVGLLYTALEFIFYGGYSYILIMMSTALFFTIKNSRALELSRLNLLFSFNDSVAFLCKPLLILCIIFFLMFFFFDFGRLVLAFALIFLLLTIANISFAMQSIGVLYLGTFKQSNLIFSYRSTNQVWPLQGLSYLETGLENNLSIISIRSEEEYLNTREMEQALKKAIALATKVIVDGSLSAETLKKFLKILQDADCLERVYVRMDDADNHSVELKTIMESFEKDCIFSTETELLELIDPTSS